MENNTFKIVTLGCKVNSYESQGIEEYLLKNGFKKAKIQNTLLLILVL